MRNIIFKLWAAALALLMLIPLASCSDENNPTVAKVGGKAVKLDEYRYFYLNYKRDADGGDEGFWGENPTEITEIETLVEQALKNSRALEKLAKKYGVSLSAEEKEAIDADIEALILEQGGEEAFEAQLKESYLTKEVLRLLITRSVLEPKLRDMMCSEMSNIIDSTDAALERDIPLNFIRVKHILIKTGALAAEMVEYTGEPVRTDEESSALIHKIYDEATAGGDFDALVKEYNEDTAMNPDDGYYITHDEFLEAFDEAAFTLAEGEMSGIIKSPNGYHIIKRYPMEEEYINDYFEELRDKYKSRRYYEILTETAAELKWELKADPNTISMGSLLSWQPETEPAE
jgi:parvulin-like peptidyl-prolyl isomerase